MIHNKNIFRSLYLAKFLNKQNFNKTSFHTVKFDYVFTLEMHANYFAS